MRISDEIINQIPILYSKYKTKKKVAEELGISTSTVTKYLNLLCAAQPSEKRKKTTITDELIEQINERYKSCENMAQVARELNISATTVKKYLSKENLSLIDRIQDDRDALWYYIYRLFGPVSEKEPVSKWNITQMQKFKNGGMPYRGQLLCLKYFFELKKNPVEKAHGSIGIIPYIFDEVESYYKKQAEKAVEVGKAIQRQLEQDRIEIKFNPSDYIGKKTRKKEIAIPVLEEN